MKRVSTVELIRNFGAHSDAALSTPIIVTKNGRDRLVLISIEQYDVLQHAYDAYRDFALSNAAGARETGPGQHHGAPQELTRGTHRNHRAQCRSRCGGVSTEGLYTRRVRDGLNAPLPASGCDQVVACQKMPALPCPLKSPTPAI